ncbi:hypothetical protein B0H13DRAFT_2510018 [Mycena leptocephala]|nr:hypothetical protein B0H13DRAFT_2510018 [Mycena leptocephala]
MSTSIFSATRVGFPPTPLSASEPRFRTSSKRYREPTDLIPTPRVDQKRQKLYEPVYFWLPVTLGTALMMLMLGIALEVLYATVALCDRLPTLANILLARSVHMSYKNGAILVLVVHAPRRLDVGNATAEESVLLDYGYFLVFPARYFNFYFSIPWSISSCLHEDMAHMCAAQSIPDIQTRGQTSYSAAQSIRSLGLAPDASELKAFAAAAGFVQGAALNDLGDPHSSMKGARPEYGPQRINDRELDWHTYQLQVFQSDCNPTHVKHVNDYIADILDLPYRLYQEYHIHPERFQPLIWFYQQQENGTEEARTVFCDPFMELYYVYASADLSSGSLTDVTMVHEYVEDSNITGPPFNNTPLNAGFLNRTAKYYTMHLALATKSMYFVEGNNTVSSVEISQPLPGAYPIGPALRLWIYQRVATPRQQAATAEPVLSCPAWDHCGRRLVDLTLRVCYDDLAMMEKKLDGLRFQLDKRTGAILVDHCRAVGEVDRGDMTQDAGIPKISFITRNQVIMWISDPSLKSKVRGLLVLMTTYIPNIRTRQEFVVKENLDVHFATDNAPQNAPLEDGLSLPSAKEKTDAYEHGSMSQ